MYGFGDGNVHPYETREEARIIVPTHEMTETIIFSNIWCLIANEIIYFAKL